VDHRRIRGSRGIPLDPQGALGRIRLSRVRHLMHEERGAATAEYAVATLAAVGFAGLLVVILRSDEVRQMLTDVVRTALTLPG
jgi:Flp pilus assembly pilin Flp